MALNKLPGFDEERQWVPHLPAQQNSQLLSLLLACSKKVVEGLSRAWFIRSPLEGPFRGSVAMTQREQPLDEHTDVQQ